MRLLVEKATIWNGSDQLIDRGSILIDGGKIQEIFNQAEAANLELPPNVERIDGTGKLAIPGLINAHTHLYSSLARGMPLPNYAPRSFTQILEQLWWRLDKALDPESVKLSARVGAMEAARCGVTTLIDHHASPHAITGSLLAVKQAVNNDVGLRGAFCYELSDRDGIAIRDEGIEENLEFLASNDPSDSMCTALFGLHASFTLSDESLSKVAEVIPEGTGVHIHVAEGPEDEEQCQVKHRIRIIERLKRFNLLRQRSVLAHCLHINEEEKDLVADSEAIVVHNPRSNMNNAVGVFGMDGFLKRGITVGLGTDGLGANMLGELFTAGILQKVSTGNSLAAGFGDLQEILFDNNPQIASRFLGIQLGRIAPGYAADIALFDYDPPTPIDAENVLGHLLFGIAVHDMHVSDLIVSGRSVIRDGRFTNLDENALYAEAREIAAQLWARIS